VSFSIIAKAIYSRLFDYIVAKLNSTLKYTGKEVILPVIGVLDIYGFEVFESNSFEQFCM